MIVVDSVPHPELIIFYRLKSIFKTLLLSRKKMMGSHCPHKEEEKRINPIALHSLNEFYISGTGIFKIVNGILIQWATRFGAK